MTWHFIYEPSHKKTCLREFVTRLDSNQPALLDSNQPALLQKLAESLESLGIASIGVYCLEGSLRLEETTLRSRSRTLKFYVTVFSTFLLWKQLRQIGGWTSVSLVTLTCESWSEGHHDPYFTVHWFCLISWRLFDIWTSHFGIISQYDLTCYLKINVGHCDLYFMVQWFCLSWRLSDVWTFYFGIVSMTRHLT